MANEVAEVVGRWLAALERGDPAPEMCDPEVTITNWTESPVPGPFHGHDGVRQWWADLSESFEDDLRFEVVDVEGIDHERAVTAQRVIGTFRLTGIELNFLWGAVVSVREGKILSAVGYISPTSARRAGGLD